MDFHHKVAVVTGASQGIGRAVAVTMAKQGADIVLASRDEKKLQAVREEIQAAGRRALVVPCDMTRDDDISFLNFLSS